MATNDERHSLIRRRVMHRPGSAPGDSVPLWEKLAGELSQIIGDSAFQALFSRSVHLASAQYAWLAGSAGPPFDGLRATLEQQAPEQAAAAAIALFTIFTDTLSLLIGEPLTTSMLYASWGQDLADSAAKEPNHE